MTFIDAELRTLIYWIEAREELRCKRMAGGPKPWTDDLLLRNYRWCNVRRLDDAVSRFVFAHWYSDEQTADVQLTAATLGRLVNWPPSLMHITGGEPFSMRAMGNARTKLHERTEADLKVFTGAYIVPGRQGLRKVDSVCNAAAGVHCRWDHILEGMSMRKVWERLMLHESIGPFLAGQIVADLAHLPCGADWPDRDTWAPIGPGSKRGINRLLGRDKEHAMSQHDFADYLERVCIEIGPCIADIWEERKLQAFDIQNCLCEYDKYRRLQLGEGTVRATYPGEPSQGLFT